MSMRDQINKAFAQAKAKKEQTNVQIDVARKDDRFPNQSDQSFLGSRRDQADINRKGDK